MADLARTARVVHKKPGKSLGKSLLGVGPRPERLDIAKIISIISLVFFILIVLFIIIITVLPKGEWYERH